MNFDSFEFLLVFLPICILSFWIFINLKKKNFAITSLILFSLFFYAWFEVKFLFLIIISVLFNYFFSNYLKKTKSFNKKKLLYIGVFLIIFILIIFKYTNFIISNLNEIFNADIILLNLIFL